MVSAGVSTVTLTEQPGSVPPAGQLLPGAAVDRVLASDLVPGVGVVDGDGAGDRDRAADRDAPGPGDPGAGEDSVPDVAVWSPLGVASSSTSVMSDAIVIPV